MNFHLTKEHSDRVWSSATGLKKNLFYKLLEQFEKSYLEIQGSTMKSRLMEGRSYCINNEEELLFFTSFSIKSGLTYDALGLVCGMDGSHAKRTQLLGIEILKHALSTLSHMPVRSFDEVTDFKELFSDIEAIIIDATEQPIQRPSNKEVQKNYYSGKKKDTQQRP
jgi:hypothetical protein